ncbi:MAG: protein kinase [Deltaproteobacteria bacterium]|nr:protein kinase [Deltaproteobacteria bacterium]MBW2535993.1 protein kinase [Deltaproteobacteria bacterium]
MAKVHLGRLIGPVGFSRTVAIKRLHPGYAKDPEFVSMFVDEARLAARIRHPNVVPVLDVVRTEDELFLVMEYIQGESLERLMTLARRRGLPIDPKYVVAIMLGVLHGLHAAHEATGESGDLLNIVHRDVSPQNVMVGTDGVPRVFDFGIAKARGRLQTTEKGQVKGKLQYMSPEQLSGGAIRREADIYAAGVVLWEALTGRPLFRGETDMMLLAQVLRGVQEPPSAHVEGLPKELDDVVMRAVSVDPADRFASARDMAVALEATCPGCSALHLGEWVQQVATRSLELRAQRVKNIESQPGLPGPPADSQPGLVQAEPAVVHNPDTVVDDFEPGLVSPEAKTVAGPLSVDSADDTTKDVLPPTRLVQDPGAPSEGTPPSAFEQQQPAHRHRSAWLAAAAVVGGLLALIALWPEPPAGDAGEIDPAGATPAASTQDAPSAASAPTATVAASSTAEEEGATSGAEPTSDPADTAQPVVPAADRTAAASGGKPRASVTESAPKPPTTATARAPKPPRRSGCDPPYTIDGRGIRRLKPECL